MVIGNGEHFIHLRLESQNGWPDMDPVAAISDLYWRAIDCIDAFRCLRVG